MESRRRCVWNSAQREWNQHTVLYFWGLRGTPPLRGCGVQMQNAESKVIINTQRIFIIFAGGRRPPFLAAEWDETVKIYVFAKKF